MAGKHLAKSMGVGYREDDTIGMVVQPCRSGLNGGKEMAIIAKGAAPAIRNRPVRDNNRDDT